MITITDYAKEQKVSYEAVRKRIKRLGDIIKPHIFTENGVKVIDDEGVKLLREGAHKVPVIVYTEEIQSELDEAKGTIKDLQEQRIKDLEKINEANERLLALSEELSKLQVEYAKLESTKQVLLEDKEKAKQDLENERQAREQAEERSTSFQNMIQEQSEEIQKQADELASYHKTVFGLYRKDKRG